MKCDRIPQKKCGYWKNGICIPITKFNKPNDEQFFCFEERINK